jgi:hypothetical protein
MFSNNKNWNPFSKKLNTDVIITSQQVQKGNFVFIQ